MKATSAFKRHLADVEASEHSSLLRIRRPVKLKARAVRLTGEAVVISRSQLVLGNSPRAATNVVTRVWNAAVTNDDERKKKGARNHFGRSIWMVHRTLRGM